MKKLLFMFPLFLAATGMAAVDSTEATSSVVSVPGKPSTQKIIGGIDLRPSYDLGTHQTRTETTLEAGYQFDPNLSVSYAQEVWNNINDKSGSQGFGKGVAEKGFFRAKVKNIYNDKANGISFSYEPRVYMPTVETARDNGMITTVRNYLILSKSISDSVTLSFIENPMYHAYNRAGNTKGGKDIANPLFENRVYLVADFALMDKKLAISVPIEMHNTRHRDYGTAAKWSHFVGIYPEVTYAVHPNVALGMAYYSESLVKSNFSTTSIDTGYDQGVWQAIVKANL